MSSSPKTPEEPVKVADVPAKEPQAQAQPERVRVALPVRTPDENTKRVKTTREPGKDVVFLNRRPPKR